jgi:hypothetical protein
MPTLLLSARQTDDAQLLWRACVALNWKVVRVHDWHVPTTDKNDLAVYGEPLFARHVAQSLGLELQEPSLDWLPKLAPKWRIRDVRLTTLAEARNITAKVFIKPADEKCFDAKVYSSGTELPGLGPLPEDLPVLVQEVVEWKIEFRCFVLNRKVVALSPYWRAGELAKADDGSWPASEKELETTTEFCESVLADRTVLVPDAVVIDVGFVEERGWAVVEANAAFSSGIYGCRPESVLSVLQRACRPKNTL